MQQRHGIRSHVELMLGDVASTLSATVSQATRKYWVDVLRAVTITLVVFRHTDNHWLTRYLSAMRMPMFFFISGLLVNRNVLTEQVSDFTKKYIGRLVVPYFVFGIATYLPWYAGNLLSPGESFIKYGPLHPLIGLVYGVSGPDNWLSHNVPLWFLTCLFVVHHLFFILSRVFKLPVHIFAVSILVGYVGCTFLHALPYRLPWNFEIAMVALVFYTMGYMTQIYDLAGALADSLTAAIVFPVALACCLIAMWLNGPIDMNMGVVGTPALLYLGGFAGVVVCIILAMRTPRLQLIILLAQNTLVILVLHSTILLGMKRVSILILGNTFVITVSDTLAYSLGATTVTIAVCLLVSRPLRSYLPWIIGMHDPARATSMNLQLPRN
jgi:acyltransferase